MLEMAHLPPNPLALWNFLKTRLGSDREKREFQAESDLLNSLRHANSNSHKYVITLFMKSGRTIVGRIGLGPTYDHSSYSKHRGTIDLFPERESPDGVYYEAITVRLAEVEGFLLQDVNYASPKQIEAIRRANGSDAAKSIGSAPGG